MKTTLILVALLAAASAAPHSFKGFLQNIKAQMPCGFPQYGIPPLAPFKMGSLSYNYGFSSLSLDLNVTNMQLNGLNSFEVNQLLVDFNNMMIIYELFFEKLSVTGDIEMNEVVNGLTVPIHGSFDTGVVGLTLRGNTILSFPENTTFVEDAKFHLDVREYYSNFTGEVDMSVNGQLVKELFGNTIKGAFSEDGGFVSKTFYDITISKVNTLLANFNSNTVLALLNGKEDYPESNAPACNPTTVTA